MTKKGARGDILHPVMLSEAKHLIFGEKKGDPSAYASGRQGKGARGDKKGCLGVTKKGLGVKAGLYKNIFQTASKSYLTIKNF
jgi:hypothetical protein